MLSCILVGVLFFSDLGKTGNPTQSDGDNFGCPDCNVILIVVDTLRADHLGCYGYERNTSPNIDRIAGDAIVFENAISQSAWTTPAHASMFTGLLPSGHGLIYYGNTGKLGGRLPTLAGILGENGYVTVGFSGGAFIGKNFGLDSGFDVYESRGRDFKENIETSIQWVRENKGNKFFLFLHGYDVHGPYTPPAGYNIFREYNGTINTSSCFIGERTKPENKEYAEFMVAQYDGEIRYVDHLLGGFFKFLEDENLFDSTIVIVTSDHGEEFFEHGGCNHIHSVYEELIKVPLIIRTPNVGIRRIRTQVPASTGILPTVLDLIDVPNDLGDENNLMRFFREDNFSFKRIISETGRNIHVNSTTNKREFLRSIRTDKWKLIWRQETVYVGTLEFNKTGFELYDLENDPEELRNVVGDYPDVFQKLRGGVFSAGSNDVYNEKADLDEETLEQLRALGYLV